MGEALYRLPGKDGAGIVAVRAGKDQQHGSKVKSATTCFTLVARTSFTLLGFAFYSFFGAVAPVEVARRAAGAGATVAALRATPNA